MTMTSLNAIIITLWQGVQMKASGALHAGGRFPEQMEPLSCCTADSDQHHLVALIIHDELSDNLFFDS